MSPLGVPRTSGSQTLGVTAPRGSLTPIPTRVPQPPMTLETLSSPPPGAPCPPQEPQRPQPPHPRVPYPSTKPWRPMSCWVSSREMRPWNQGWVRWMAVGTGVSGLGGPPERGRDPLNPPRLTGAERGAVAGCGEAEPVRRLLLGTQSEEGASGWARGAPPHSPAPQLTLQACASSRAAVRTSLGFSITRPVHPEKSMATRALSETLLWGGQGGHRRVPKGRGVRGTGDTHQGSGADPGGLAQPCLSLLVVAVELHPVLGGRAPSAGEGPC